METLSCPCIFDPPHHAEQAEKWDAQGSSRYPHKYRCLKSLSLSWHPRAENERWGMCTCANLSCLQKCRDCTRRTCCATFTSICAASWHGGWNGVCGSLCLGFLDHLHIACIQQWTPHIQLKGIPRHKVPKRPLIHPGQLAWHCL